MATRVFEGIKLFQEILKRTMAGTFLRVKFYQNPISSFRKEDVKRKS